MATWLEDDITGEWEWLGPPREPTREARRRAEFGEVPAITRMLDRDSVLFRNVQREFARGAREVVVPLQTGPTSGYEVSLTAELPLSAPTFETHRITHAQRQEITRLERERCALESQIAELRHRMMTPFIALPPEGLDTERRLSYDRAVPTYESMQAQFTAQHEAWARLHAERRAQATRADLREDFET
jgi:hypothetical protein